MMGGILKWVFLLILAGSCTSVYFKEPQPRGAVQLQQFPENVTGQYFIDEDTITISTDSFYYFELKSQTFLQQEVKETVMDLIDHHASNVPIRQHQDTIEVDYQVKVEHDISDSLVLKHHRKYYYVNLKVEEQEYWEVVVFKVEKNGNLKLKMIETSEDEIKSMEKKLNFTKIDDRQYLIDPSPKQLRKLIKSTLFSDWQEMKRVE